MTQPDPIPDRSAYRTLRLRNAVLREQLAEGRLRRAVKLQESQSYWLEPYAELMSRLRTRDLAYRSPASRYDRRYGRDYPIYTTEQELSLLRAPSRILVQTNPYAAGLVRALTGYVFGKKSDVRFAADDAPVQAAVQRVIDAFQSRNDWHGGKQPSLERELFGQRGLPDGEWFLVHYCRPDGSTDVRAFDPEQCTIPPGSDFREWGFGIYADPDDPHRPEAYWFILGDTSNDGREFDASRVVHCKRNATRAMKRGIPDFSFDTYEQFVTAIQLTTKLGQTAAEQASIVGVRQHKGATVEQVETFRDNLTDYQERDYVTGMADSVRRFKDGGWEDMGENTEYVEGPSAANGSTHLAVLAGLLRCAAARHNVPEWMVAGSSGTNDYATALSAASQFTRAIWAEQQQQAGLIVASVEIAVEHHARTRGVEVLTPDGSGVARTLSWEQVRRIGKIECELPSPEVQDQMQQTQRRSIMNQAGVLSVQTWQQQEQLDPEKEADNIAEYKQSNPDQGQALQLPGGFGGDDGGGLGESLTECGGEGSGTPGPCPTDHLHAAFHRGDVTQAHVDAAKAHVDRMSGEQFAVLVKTLGIAAAKNKTRKAVKQRYQDRYDTFVRAKMAAESVVECGGKGGKPGPCPTKTADVKKAVTTGATAAKGAATAGVQAIKDRVAAVTAGVPDAVKAPLTNAYHALHQTLMAGNTAAKALATETAKARGATPEQTERLGRILGAIDLLVPSVAGAGLAATGNVVAGKLAAYMPVGSMSYVLYSTARDPKATIAAAGKLLRERFPERVKCAYQFALGAIAHPLTRAGLHESADGSYAESLMEWALSEAGFTGVITDKRGAKIHYADGKRVAAPDADAPAADKTTATKPAVRKPRVPEEKPSEKALRAKAAHVLVGKEVQQYAEEHNEPRFAKAMGGVSFPDSEPVDVVVGVDGVVKHGIELKTMTVGKDDKLTMNSYAQVRKIEWERAQGATFHTVVSGDRTVFNANGAGDHDESKRVYYYRRGVAGSARIGSLHRVDGGEAELKRLMAMPEAELPAAAQRTDGHLRQGRWKFFQDDQGKGYKNSKTGQIFRAKK